RVRDRLRDEPDGADRVVVSGDREVDPVRLRVRVRDGDHRNAETVRLAYRDRLAPGIDHEEGPREAAHLLQPREVLRELLALAVEEKLLLLRVEVEGVLFLASL